MIKSIAVTIGDKLHPIQGGGALRTLKAAKEFSSRGYNVKVFGPSEKNEINGLQVENITQASQEKSMFKSSAKLMYELFFKLVKNRKNIDLVFSHNIAAAIPSLLFCKIFSKRFVYDMTDLQTEYFKENKKGIVWKQVVNALTLLEYTTIRLSPKVIVVSRAMKDVLVKKGIKPDNINVVYDGAEIKEFSTSKKKKDHITIIHHGGISPHDGVTLIPKAAKYILQELPDVKFHILGSGKDLDNVKKLVEEYGLGQSFTFTGWLPYEKMKEYLKEADIGLITRTNTVANNTILTLKLLEYWASGTAAVAPCLSGIAEVSRDGDDVMLFKAEDEKALASSISQLIKDKKLLKRL